MNLSDLFSIKNEINGIHKIVTVLGMKFKFVSKRLVNKRITDMMKLLKPYRRYCKLSKYQINKGNIDVQIAKFKKRNIIGINQEEERRPRIIVSLTSFPERNGDMHYSIYSLLNQTLKPDKVILWLAKEQFPDGEDDISDEVLELKKHGLTIEYTHDIRSFKKSIPTLNQYPDDILVTADDDIYYPDTWLEKLYNEYKANPDCIYAHRVVKVGFKNKNKLLPFNYWDNLIDDESCSLLNFPTTGGGVLYPPHCLYKDVANEKLIKRLSPCSDETWFWAMAILNHKKIKVVKNPVNYISKVNVQRDCYFGGEITLGRENQSKNTRDNIINGLIEHYPELMEILIQAKKENC